MKKSILRIPQKSEKIGKGIDDPLDLLLVFLPADEAQKLFGGQSLLDPNSKNEPAGGSGLQFNQKINNGKNWFKAHQNGVIEGGLQFIQEGNVRRHWCTSFSLALDSKNQQIKQTKIPIKEGTPEIVAVQAQLEYRIEALRKELQDQFQLRLFQEITALEKKLQAPRPQITYAEARKKYIDDLCD